MVQQLAALLFSLTFAKVTLGSEGVDFIGTTSTGDADGFAEGFTATDADGDGVAIAVGATAAGLFTTLLTQTNLPLFLTQVNLLPATVVTCPAFLHAAPALTAADDAGAPTSAIANAATNKNREIFTAPV